MALQKFWFSILLSNKKQYWALEHFSICRFLFGYKVITLNIAFYFPFLFFQVDMGLPFPQRVVQLPEIAWDQYTTSLGNFEREFKNRKRNSRRVKLIFDKGKRKWAYVTRKKWPVWKFNNSPFVLLTVGIPARPKSPLDPKKDGESVSYSVLPLSDGPEGSTNSRPQVVVEKERKKLQNSKFNFFFLFWVWNVSVLTVTSNVHVGDDMPFLYSNLGTNLWFQQILFWSLMLWFGFGLT